MKSKKEHIDFWLLQSEDDWSAVDTLFSGQNYVQSLFFAHLVIEKLCKAIWIKHNDSNVPPKTHNLIYLLSATPVEISSTVNEFLLNLNRFQLEGRYPDYRTKMNEICDEKFTKDMLNVTNELREWLIEQLR